MYAQSGYMRKITIKPKNKPKLFLESSVTQRIKFALLIKRCVLMLIIYLKPVFVSCSFRKE